MLVRVGVFILYVSAWVGLNYYSTYDMFAFYVNYRVTVEKGCNGILVVHSHEHLERIFSLHLKFLYICTGIIYPLKLQWFFLTLQKLKTAFIWWKRATTCPPPNTHTHTHTHRVPSPSLTVTSLSDVTQPNQLEKHSHTDNSSTLYIIHHVSWHFNIW
jgi:hypothetical protein